MENLSEILQLNAKDSWGVLAWHLIEAEKNMSWEKTHDSFSQWISDLSRQLNKSEATLWRALSSGRYYNELLTELSNEKIKYPNLVDSNLAATAESLELLDKISRAAPANLVREFKLRMMTGEISRSELRIYWENYKKVLQGKTARGRNVPPPKFNGCNLQMIELRLKADCVAGIVKFGSSWLGSESAAVYKVIQTGIDGTLESLVVLHSNTKNEDVQIHGIRVYEDIEGIPLKYLERFSKLGFDFFWLATPTLIESEKELRRLESSSVGILMIKPDGVEVIHKATRLLTESTMTEAILRNVIKLILKE